MYFVADRVDQDENQGFEGITAAPRAWLRLKTAESQPGQDSQERVFQEMSTFSADKNKLVLGLRCDAGKYPVQQGADNAGGVLE